jgi:hypothetical protein
VLQFWSVEFASWNDKFQAEAIAPVLNKVGAFTANPVIRNIIGQPKSSFNIRQIMDEGKILIVNLSKGLIGEDNAGILGAFIVTKIQLAAMSRSDIESVDDRRPFYLYVDEFQNFATDSFATILSEARKYGLNLTVANQYISQMTDTVRNAVFGNVGTTISFRASADDAPILSKQFEPQFEAADLLQMHNRNFIINMVINGEKQPAFSASTLNLPPVQTNLLPNIIAHTRSTYSRQRDEVQAEISQRMTPGQTTSTSPVASPQNTPPQPPPAAAPSAAAIKTDDSHAAAQKSADEEPQAPKKRKRTRSRSKSATTKAGEDQQLPTVTDKVTATNDAAGNSLKIPKDTDTPSKKADEGTVLRIRN